MISFATTTVFGVDWIFLKPYIVLGLAPGGRVGRIDADVPDLVLTLLGDSRALGNVTVRGRSEDANASEQVSMIRLTALFLIQVARF